MDWKQKRSGYLYCLAVLNLYSFPWKAMPVKGPGRSAAATPGEHDYRAGVQSEKHEPELGSGQRRLSNYQQHLIKVETESEWTINIREVIDTFHSL